MPIYVRAGSIVPLDPIRQHTGEVVDEPTILRVYRGADGDFTLYDDDGASLAYLDGAGSWTRLRWNDATRTLTLEPAAPEGSTNQVAPKVFEVRLHPEGTSARLTYSGQAVEMEL
jgi:alpha-glucosidase (family GH31 glycosyl hydrolase)